MNQSKFLSSKVIDSEKQFDKALEDESFYDILPIDKQACLCLHDSMVLNSKCIQSCPAFVYSASKLILWRTYLFIASAFAGYDRRRTRLTLTDTDSMIISTSRPLHKAEEKELTHIQRKADIDKTKTTLFDDTNIALNSAKVYYKIFRRIIDPSNLDQGKINTNSYFSTKNTHKPTDRHSQFIKQSNNYLSHHKYLFSQKNLSSSEYGSTKNKS